MEHGLSAASLKYLNRKPKLAPEKRNHPENFSEHPLNKTRVISKSSCLPPLGVCQEVMDYQNEAELYHDKDVKTNLNFETYAQQVYCPPEAQIATFATHHSNFIAWNPQENRIENEERVHLPSTERLFGGCDDLNRSWSSNELTEKYQPAIQKSVKAFNSSNSESESKDLQPTRNNLFMANKTKDKEYSSWAAIKFDTKKTQFFNQSHNILSSGPSSYSDQMMQGNSVRHENDPVESENLFLPFDEQVPIELNEAHNVDPEVMIKPEQHTMRNEVNVEVSEIEESLISQRFPESFLERSLMAKEKIIIDTSYTNSVPIKSHDQDQMFEDYCRDLLPKDWDIVYEDEKLDTTQVSQLSLKYLKRVEPNVENISVGSRFQVIYEDEDLDCEELKDSISEMEKSFGALNYSIISSTPIRNRSLSQSCTQAKPNTQPKESQQNDEDEDNANRTKSFLQSQVLESSRNSAIPNQPGQGNQRISCSQIDSFQSFGSLLGNLPPQNIDNSNEELDYIFSQIDGNPAVHGKQQLSEPRVCEHQSNNLNDSQEPVDDIETLSQLNPPLAEKRRIAILSQIENIFKALLESLVQQKPMELKIREIRNWKDCELNDGGVLSQKESNIITRSIKFNSKASERTFTLTVTVMCEIYKMLSRKMKSTRRELYYSDVDLYNNQTSVNKAIETICAMLNVQEYELGILSSSRGLIAGDLAVITDEGRIDFSTPQAVPQNPSAITQFETSADFILVVEKETVFQRLVNDNIFERIDYKIVLVTAKGFPDVNTRVLLKKFAEKTGKPIFIIVDADPHGFEIMCTYKFGSKLKIHNSAHLAIPSIKWIGVHPSDIAILDVLSIELSESEMKKVDNLLERPYVNEHMRRELNCFKEQKMKAEIESLFLYSTNFFINDYIPRKISTIDMPT